MKKLINIGFFFKICLFLCSEDPVFVIIAWFLLLMLFSLWCHQLFFKKNNLTLFLRYVKSFHTDLGRITGNQARCIILSDKSISPSEATCLVSKTTRHCSSD